MKYICTATFTPNEDGTKYYCRVPDLPGCITTGDNLDDAIEMITDAACSIIRIDTLAYRAATDTRTVRKNVSLPAWMAALAEKRGVNCSQVLQDGLMKLLNTGIPFYRPVDRRSAHRYNIQKKRMSQMNLQEYIDSRNITKYHLSQISGVPKTTVLDICSGKSSLQKCSAKTIQQLAKALGCSMEYLMSLDAADTGYDRETGLPKSKQYLECGLPAYLQSSLDNMIASWKIIDSGKTDLHWDLCWSELNADINSAETEQEISAEQAWYLREKYLRMERED